MSVTVTRIVSGDATQDHTWLVLEGSMADVPAVTKRRSIALAAIASGVLTLATEKAALIADVEAAYTRYLALQTALGEL